MIGKLRLLLLFIAAVTAFFFIVVAAGYWNRPMFANHYVWHDMSLLPCWRQTTQVGIDANGIGVLIDVRSNIVVVFCGFSDFTEETPDKLLISLSTPYSGSDCRVRDTGTDQEFLIPRVVNRLYVLTRDGSTCEFQLDRGKGAELYFATGRSHLEKLKTARLDEFIKDCQLDPIASRDTRP
jgi:hypothetical protein